MWDIPLLVGSVQSFISSKINPFFYSTIFHKVPGISDYILKYPTFSTTHSYAPNVAFLLAVSMNPPISCHSIQPITATNYTFLINSFSTISVSLFQLHLPLILVDSLPRPRNVPRHALCPVSTVCKRNTDCVVQPCRFYQNDEIFSDIFGLWKWKRCGMKYLSAVHILFVCIFFHEIGKFPFFLETSRPLYRGYFRPTDWYFRLTGSKSLAQFL